MQLPIEPNDDQLTALIAAVHDDRIERYLPAAQGSRADAFRLYTWNGCICEAFYMPLHYAEISIRNAIHRQMIARCSDRWFENLAILNTLGGRQRDDLDTLLEAEMERHGDQMTAHHLVSELSFGFWQHMMTKRFNRILWPRDLHGSFPNLPNSMGRQDVHDRIESIRKWRNRIAHHKPAFDQGPMRKHQEILQLIRWTCNHTADWVTANSKVTAAIDLRPIKAQ